MPPSPLIRLSAELAAQLHSSASVGSLHAAAEELVRNSMEAQAGSVSVVVDLERLSLRVEDDGHGVALQEARALGEAHYSSKGASGGRGLALASLAQLCVLEVASRAAGSWESWAKTWAAGQVQGCGLSLEPLPRHGTTVSVRDFLYNQPVRRRVLLADARAETERIRERLFSLALLYPAVALSLRTSTGTVVLQLPANRGMRDTYAAAYGLSAAQALLPVAHSDAAADLHCTGLASSPHLSAPLAGGFHLYINSRPLCEGSAAELRRVCDSAFSQAASGAGAGLAGWGAPAGGARAVRARPRLSAVLSLSLPPARVHWDAAGTPSFPDQPRLEHLLRAALSSAWADAAAAAPSAAAAPLSLPRAPKRSLPEPEAEHPQPLPAAACARGCADCAATPPSPPFALPSGWQRRRSAPPPATEALQAMDALFQSWTSPVWPLAPLRDPPEAPRPASITVAHLRNAVLVGTVPGRYLIARSRGGDGAVLFAVDQHAADERCLLERLTWEHEARLGGGGSPPRVRRQDAELLQLSSQLCAALQSHAAVVRRAGWRWEEVADQQPGVQRLLAAPSEPLDPHARLGGEHLAEWLTELCGIPAGPAARLACPHPPVVSRLLASAACRHAIMFGDVLRWEEAEALLHALGGAQMPLSCAHGRPTAAPLALLPSEREGGGEAGARAARSLGRARALRTL